MTPDVLQTFKVKELNVKVTAWRNHSENFVNHHWLGRRLFAISLKFGTIFDHVTHNVLRRSKPSGRRSRSQRDGSLSLRIRHCNIAPIKMRQEIVWSPPRTAAPHQKYIRGWVLHWTWNSDRHFARPLYNFFRGKKCKIWPKFSSAIVCDAFLFKNWVSYLKITRCSAIAERPRCRVRYSFRHK